MLIHPAINAAASHTMQRASLGADENTMMICTGKGMVYIDLQHFWDTGEMHYVNADGTELDPQAELTDPAMSACELATFAYSDMLAVANDPIDIAFQRYHDRVRAREARAVQTFPYLASNPRAPPAVNQRF